MKNDANMYIKKFDGELLTYFYFDAKLYILQSCGLIFVMASTNLRWNPQLEGGNQSESYPESQKPLEEQSPRIVDCKL